jgi:hypothetical protein
VPESKAADEVGQRVRRIGDDQDDGLRRRRQELGKHFPVNIRVGLEQLESAGGIGAVRRPAGAFVHAGGNHDHRRALQIGIVAIPNVDGRRKRCAVTHIGRDGKRPLAVSVQHHDVARAAAHDCRKDAGRPNHAGADYTNLRSGVRHDVSLSVSPSALMRRAKKPALSPAEWHRAQPGTNRVEDRIRDRGGHHRGFCAAISSRVAPCFAAAPVCTAMQPSHCLVTATASAISSRVFASSFPVLLPASLRSR